MPNITITMREPRRSEDGLSIMAKASVQSVSQEFGAYLVQIGAAVDTNNALAQSPDSLTRDEVVTVRGVVSKDGVLDAASAGASSPWFVYTAGMRLAYALDSGTTTTTFSIDFSADGVTSLGQAFTGTWASSTVAEITPPLYLTNPQARFLRFNVLTGGPLSVSRNI